MSHHDHHSDNEHSGSSHHFILPDKLAYKIAGALLFFTFITVWIGQFDFGKWNFFVAMLIATVKGSLVALFFMGLKYDKKENTVIMIGSLLFFAIFMALTFTDLLFRQPMNINPALLAPPKGASQFKRAWVSSPELLKHGEELFKMQCVSCHGDRGAGDGVAAAALNPKPRNFTLDADWVNGRKPSQVFETLTKGVNAMPSFGSLSLDDRWSLVHYVLALGPDAPKDTDADLVKVGIDPTKEDGGLGGGDKSIPIDTAIDLMAE